MRSCAEIIEICNEFYNTTCCTLNGKW